MNVLIIAPHPDDEAIGCGGAILTHTGRGDRVSTAFLTSGEAGLKHLPKLEAWQIRQNEANAAAQVLGTLPPVFLQLMDWCINLNVSAAAQALAPVLTQVQPELIYLPHPEDAHPDHQASLSVIQAALEIAGLPRPRLLGYEIWSPLPTYDTAVDITPVMPAKLRAVRCYPSQLTQYRYDRAVRGLNLYRGALATRTRFAEIFRTL